jgi:hypothetical protein
MRKGPSKGIKTGDEYLPVLSLLNIEKIKVIRLKTGKKRPAYRNRFIGEFICFNPAPDDFSF